jgi:hypothetical protein
LGPHRRIPHIVVVAIGAAMCVGWADPAFTQFTSFNDHSRSILEGNWQSCRESDGVYSERIYDGKVPGLGPFELHLGPYHEFALFRGVQDEHRDHGSSENLLQPDIVDVQNNTGTRKWYAAGLRFEVTLAGGSRDDCESWWVALRRISPTT